ncbi:MAG: glutamate 5-kinase [Desulfovibrio sp.]|nr:glutamate 5-kinase [Desulfovibrio sp.]
MSDASPLADKGWLAERGRATAQARTIIVKVGSAVLTNAAGLDGAVMRGLADQLAALKAAGPKGRRLILVTSAAVAAGRAVLAAHDRSADTTGLSARQAVAAVGQCQLMRVWDEAFARHGIPTAQVLLTREDLRARQRFLNARNTFAELLAWGVLPIVNENDTVSVQELKFGDNDSLSSLLANLVGADLCVNLTSAPGVRAADPRTDPDAPVLDHIDDAAALDLNRMCGGKTSVGTGGMYSKLRAARRSAQIGVPTLILPGRETDVLTRAFEPGSRAGTWVRPSSHAISRRKFWLAYQADPAGAVVIDDGAADALLHKGGSLLPGGVRNVEGSFQKGALVSVRHAGNDIGVGLTNYTAAELKKIMGLKRIEVAAVLGDAHYPEVIHRDNLLLDAAV